MDNPFDLTKLISTDKIIEKKIYKPNIISDEEKTKLLENYEKVPHDKWLQLQQGAHIRYLRKDGDMRKGGFIKYTDPSGSFIYIVNTPYESATTKGWRINLDTIDTIWAIKTNIPKNINNIDEKIANIEDDIRQLKLEIQRVTNQQKRIIQLIARTIQK